MVEKTAYVVMLPLTDEQVLPLLNSYTGSAETTNALMNNAIRAIGTPVDSSVPVVARTSEIDLACVKKGKSGDIYSHESWECSDVPVFTVPLVRQSDHLATLAEKQAEVERLRTEDDKGLAQVIEERDECEKVINDLYQTIMGDSPEWSNNFGYRDAVEDVVDYVHALRTKALAGAAS